MKAKITQFVLMSATVAAWVLGIGGCSTTEVTPLPPPAVAPPPYVQVVHPAGFDMGDIRAIFTDASAPKVEDLAGCDADLKKLKTLTQSEAEITGGVRELVKSDPVRYHWCFYGNILRLETDLKVDSFVDERQKKVLDTYAFLAPVSRAFLQEYHDSRYMRWAVKHYRQLSEWVFYRKLDMTAQSTSDLVEAANPFGFYREPTAPKPILEKYNILLPVPTAPTAATNAPATAPAPPAVSEEASLNAATATPPPPEAIQPEPPQDRKPAAVQPPSVVPGMSR